MSKFLRLIFSMIAVAGGCWSISAQAGDEELWGTYKLVSATQRFTDNGETGKPFGANPNGYITYGRDGRMMTVCSWGDRPRIERPETATVAQHAQLFETLWAYAGNYHYDGSKVEHHVDMSWNETWTGKTITRYVSRDAANRLILTTAPQADFTSGRMTVITLIWQRME